MRVVAINCDARAAGLDLQTVRDANWPFLFSLKGGSVLILGRHFLLPRELRQRRIVERTYVEIRVITTAVGFQRGTWIVVHQVLAHHVAHDLAGD